MTLTLKLLFAWVALLSVLFAGAKAVTSAPRLFDDLPTGLVLAASACVTAVGIAMVFRHGIRGARCWSAYLTVILVSSLSTFSTGICNSHTLDEHFSRLAFRVFYDDNASEPLSVKNARFYSLETFFNVWATNALGLIAATVVSRRIDHRRLNTFDNHDAPIDQTKE